MSDYAELFDKDFREHQEGRVLTNKAVQRYDTAFSLISSLKVDKALDVGCATGLFAVMLDKWIANDVSGIDVSDSAIGIAKESFPYIHFEVANMTRIPFPENAFGIVSCLDVIYYLDDLGRRKAVDEIARVLKSNGYLLISTSWPWKTKTRTGTSYIKPRELLELLGDRFILVGGATTNMSLGFLRSGVAMLLRLTQ